MPPARRCTCACRAFLGIIAAAPVLAGLALIGDRTSPAAGVALLLAFAAAMTYIVRRSRHQAFLMSHEVVRRARSRPVPNRSLVRPRVRSRAD